MKTSTKDLFLEIIKFVDEKDYKTLYFDNINKKINTNVLSLIFQEILIWNHPVFLDLKISHEDKLDIN
ncbi:hypothetical protein [Tenacibaculum sp. 190524A02b]|uniref:hypothetical protein n=1 Tax=Tenacibaculum vairaonense TaxID=3137860 RepID=UPI0031FB3AD0